MKCHLKHNLGPGHFAILPIMIEFGAVVYDKRRPRHVTVLYHEDMVFGSGYELALKATSLGHELHVCSFHKTTPAEYRRLIRKHDLLRDLKR